MDPLLVIGVIVGYFFVLMLISRWSTGKQTGNMGFFTGNRESPWYLVAFGMIGASLSGVTFISIPGWVGDSHFYYMQIVCGYLAGYLVIGTILMPLYYRLNLISIYYYLKQRFGNVTYKTGASFFLLSRTIGAAFRLFLVANVLQLALFDQWNVPYWTTVAVTIVLIWLYTFKGGIHTIVRTDALQTFFMLLSVAITIYLIGVEFNQSFSELWKTVRESSHHKLFNWDYKSQSFFGKQFLAGAFIAIAMTGLDQDMMQKNLSCRNIGEAQKNMFWFSVSLIFVNYFFLSLGALLYIYANQQGVSIPAEADQLYPMLALDHFHIIAGIFFLLGIVAAAYSSADSALTALTTSFSVDILGYEQGNIPIRMRYFIHLIFSVVLFTIIVVFKSYTNESVISSLFTAAGFTYGPLLGFYSFGLFWKRKVRDKWIPVVAVLAPVISYIIGYYDEQWLNGYDFGFELIIVNGLLTFGGLWLLSDAPDELAQTEAA